MVICAEACLGIEMRKTLVHENEAHSDEEKRDQIFQRDSKENTKRYDVHLGADRKKKVTCESLILVNFKLNRL